MLRFRLAAAPLAALVICACGSAPAGSSAPPVKTLQSRPAAAVASTGSWTEYHRDDAHTGYDSTVPGATGATTGWTSPTLIGEIYGEPLVYNGLVYVATLQNVVYALHQSDGTVAWSKTLNAPETSGWTCGNINPTGILGTGLIDATGGRVYFVDFEHATESYYLYAFDLATGSVLMTTQIAPTGFDWHIQQERGALAMSTDRTHIYVPFGGRLGDCGPYHGWVVGVPTNGGAPDELYKTVSTGEGVWAGGGVVVDDSTGNVFFATGNAIPCSGAQESDSVIRTGSTLGSPAKFQPPDWSAHWCATDTDLGSVAPVLISPSLLFETGKYGQGFLVSPSTMAQLYPAPSPYTGVDVCVGNHSDASFGSVSYANGRVYLTCEGNGIVSLAINAGAPSFSSCDSSCTAAGTWHSSGVSTVGPPIIAGGAVWAVSTAGSGLYGFDASTGAQIFHSAAFNANHFSTPSEAGGQIFVGAGTVVRSFNIALNPCTSVTASAAPPSPASAGTTVTITAVSTGCPNPLYEFWYLGQGSSTWQLVKPYSAGNSYTWNSTGALAGSHVFSVWAHDSAGSGANCTSLGCYDTYGNTTYTITTPSCASVAASASPTSPQPASTPITITGTAPGCTNASPLYEFWYLGQGSSTWQLVQGYSTSNTYSWSSTGARAGSHVFSVWVRDSASPGLQAALGSTYDAYGSTTFSITVSTCTSVTASAAPSSPQASGTAITLTASASGCTNPRYEFWILAPGSTWTVMQAYSNNATFNWNTTGLAPGTYRYSVWARDASSGASYDTYFPGTDYTLT